MGAHVYQGYRGPEGNIVTVDGILLDPCPKVTLIPSSEFEWGYGGGGPARLAFAILAHHFGNEEKALSAYRGFRDSVIGDFREDSWSLTTSQIELFFRGSVEVPMTLNELFRKVRGDKVS